MFVKFKSEIRAVTAPEKIKMDAVKVSMIRLTSVTDNRQLIVRTLRWWLRMNPYNVLILP